MSNNMPSPSGLSIAAGPWFGFQSLRDGIDCLVRPLAELLPRPVCETARSSSFLKGGEAHASTDHILGEAAKSKSEANVKANAVQVASEANIHFEIGKSTEESNRKKGKLVSP
jgi:hypothetical protein